VYNLQQYIKNNTDSTNVIENDYTDREKSKLRIDWIFQGQVILFFGYVVMSCK
jgi:hypothetical protein